jgi:arginyl-tRNA synthetase
MNTAIQAALDHAVQSLQQAGILPSDWTNNSVLTRTKDRSHGDFASNIAMVGAKAAGMKPRDLAEKVLAHLPEVADITKAEIAGQGLSTFS